MAEFPRLSRPHAELEEEDPLEGQVAVLAAHHAVVDQQHGRARADRAAGEPFEDLVRQAGVRGEESTLLYMLSHTTSHTNLHINKST